MYSSSPSYGGTDVLSLLFSAGGAWAALSFVAFVAAIVCAVLLYRKYVSAPGTPRTAPGAKRDFGPFLRFERFWSEKILIALFIYNMCLIAFESVAAAVSLLFMIAFSPAGVLLGLVVVALVFAVSEVLNRLFYEFVMLIVKMWRNTQDIRDRLEKVRPAVPSVPGGAGRAEASPEDSSARAARPSAPAAAQPAAPAPAVPSGSPAEQAWVCPSCGAHNRQGVFCAQCGKRRS